MAKASTTSSTMKRIIWQHISWTSLSSSFNCSPFRALFHIHYIAYKISQKISPFAVSSSLSLTQHNFSATQIVSLFLNWTEMLWIIQRTKANARSFLPFVFQFTVYWCWNELFFSLFYAVLNCEKVSLTFRALS